MGEAYIYKTCLFKLSYNLIMAQTIGRLVALSGRGLTQFSPLPQAHIALNLCVLPRAFSTTASSMASAKHKITIIPGDGIGPEVMQHTKDVLDTLKLPIVYEEYNFSYHDTAKNNDPAEVLAAIERNRCALTGHISPPPDNYAGPRLNVIKNVKFFANVTYIKSMEGIDTRHKGVDMIVVREQMTGEYSGLEHMVWSEASGVAVEALKVSTVEDSRRIAKFAFDLAGRKNRKKVTCVHKANIMKQGDGMFLQACREVAELYPHMQFEDLIVDNMCMQLASKPQQFDVIVTTNLYGNIIENLGAGLIGGVGIVPGEDYSANNIMFGMGVRHDGQKLVGK